jgi:hypothetical protein
MSDFLYILGVLVVLSFAWVCFFGAPFVPTRKRWARAALELAEIKKSDLVVDLGSGSGTILKILSEGGVRSVGFELNPILWVVSSLRFWFTDLATVRLANFWRQDLPKGTTVVYVFAVVRDAAKLEKYLATQSKRGSLRVITFGFELPTKKTVKRAGGGFLYQF